MEPKASPYIGITVDQTWFPSRLGNQVIIPLSNGNHARTFLISNFYVRLLTCYRILKWYIMSWEYHSMDMTSRKNLNPPSSNKVEPKASPYIGITLDQIWFPSRDGNHALIPIKGWESCEVLSIWQPSLAPILNCYLTILCMLGGIGISCWSYYVHMASQKPDGPLVPIGGAEGYAYIGIGMFLFLIRRNLIPVKGRE